MFSIVSAIYDVSPYIDEFFRSLESQSFGIENLDILLIDDGSSDDSGEKCDEFARRWPDSVRVLHKANGGQASARNIGLDHVEGSWVTFTDPDDVLDENYFKEAAKFLNMTHDLIPEIASTNQIFLLETTGERSNTHPLKTKFSYGNRLYDLRVHPDYIQMSAATALFRAEVIRRCSLRFDERIRPTFEDSHFVGNYLLAVEAPVLASLASSVYYYRRRANNSSTLATSGAQPERYTTAPRYGHLDLLRAAERRCGSVPRWTQNMVLYDLAWYLRADSSVSSSTGSLTDEVFEEFHRLVAEIRGYISSETIREFSIIVISDDIRFALLYGYNQMPQPPVNARLSDVDTDRGLVQIKYRFTGDLPDERIYLDNHITDPIYAKIRSAEFYRRTLLHERILWMPIGSRIRITIGGNALAIADERLFDRKVIELNSLKALAQRRVNGRPDRWRRPQETLVDRFKKQIRTLVKEFSRPALFELALSGALHSSIVRRRFSNAWVFMDRDKDAGDSGEALYKHVSTRHPEVNAWFVLNRSSPDWPRLRKAGVRLVPYGSWRWQLLLLSADHLASSHIDNYIVQPLHVGRFGPPRWKFTFLQHGVIKDDLSRWLNSKRIDLFITSSRAEYESITADYTPYLFTKKDVRLTGLPRFDSLSAKRSATPSSTRDLLLIMPTWRLNLVGDIVTTASHRAPKGGFARSSYAENYSKLLRSEHLQRFASAHGLEVVFMPHPNMEPYLKDFDAPTNVSVVSYADADVQEMLARGAYLITDYSSIAFNAAWLEMPTLYFQFDQEAFYSGSHPGRRGYFRYETDGFGPVCTSVDAVENVLQTLTSPLEPMEPYRARMRSTFAFRDGNNSERVFRAMNQIGRPEASQAPQKASRA